MFKKLELIRTNEGNNIFARTNILKKLFSYVVFIFAFSATLVLLFRMTDKITNLDSIKNIQIKEYAVYSFYIGFTWFASIHIIRTIKTSIKSLYLSYLMAMAGIAYLCWMLFWGVNYKVVEWVALYQKLKWIIPIWSLLIAWDFLRVFIEFKIRPFFSKYLFYKVITSGVLVYLAIMINWIVQTYLIDKQQFNYLEQMTLFHLIFGSMMILVMGFTLFKMSRYAKFISSEISAGKVLHYQERILTLGTIFIWFISTVAIKNVSYISIIYIVIAILLIGMLVAISLTKNEAGGKSQIYRLTSIGTVFGTTLIFFIFNEYVEGSNINSIIWIASIFTIFLWDAWVSPKVSPLNRILERAFIIFVIIYLLGTWFMSNIIDYNLSDIPFDLHLVLQIIPLGIIGIQLITETLKLYWVLHIISSNSNKLIKLKTKKPKEVLNV